MNSCEYGANLLLTRSLESKIFDSVVDLIADCSMSIDKHVNNHFPKLVRDSVFEFIWIPVTSTMSQNITDGVYIGSANNEIYEHYFKI